MVRIGFYASDFKKKGKVKVNFYTDTGDRAKLRAKWRYLGGLRDNLRLLVMLSVIFSI